MVRGVYFLVFLVIGFLIGHFAPLSAGVRFASSDGSFDSVQRVSDGSIVVYPDKAVISVPGLSYARVVSNSMAPFITDKSTVFELPLSPGMAESEVRRGDIISFVPPDDWMISGPVLHLVEDIIVVDGSIHYVTRGYNQGFDPSPVPAGNVIGVVVGTVR